MSEEKRIEALERPDKLIAEIIDKIKHCKQYEEDPDLASFGMLEGVLISSNSADNILQYIDHLESRIKEMEEVNRKYKMALYDRIEDGCNLKMNVCGNAECGHRKKIISGLNGCLCNPDNCIRIKMDINED